MENKPYIKTVAVAFIFAIGAIMTSIAFNDAVGQGVVVNQSTVFPNNTETAQNLENLTGSDSAILANDTNISNPNNTLENSLATNEKQSY
ncbi:MAG: hypothetical protein H0X50_00440 [Nitrosopumilus sp.]|nr:hypothetical protein [Nitrosopumilus sp.]